MAYYYYVVCLSNVMYYLFTCSVHFRVAYWHLRWHLQLVRVGCLHLRCQLNKLHLKANMLDALIFLWNVFWTYPCKRKKTTKLTFYQRILWWQSYLDFSGFSNFKRIWDKSPTSNSSTLWLIPTEVSMNLQSYAVAMAFPSTEIMKWINLMEIVLILWRSSCLPSALTARLRAKSALFATSITAFWAIFWLVHRTCKTCSATLKLSRSDAAYITQYPCGS